MDESNVIDPITHRYVRSSSPNLLSLVNVISGMYSEDQIENHTLITTSGMHAITTTLLTIAMSKNWNGFNLIYSDEMYCDTHRFIFNFSEMYSKIYTWPINVENTKRIIEIFEDDLKNNDNVLFIESCSNPNSKMFDWSIIPNLRRLSKSLIIIVDNTWLTHLIFNPLKYDVDIVVTSLTKYYSGGTAIMGACIFSNTNKHLFDIAVKKNCYEGIHISPKIVNNVRIMAHQITDRMSNSSNLTIRVLNLLINTIPKLYENINHPYITNPNVVQRYFKNNMYPSVFTISVRCKLNRFRKILNKLNKFDKFKNLKHETSFGSYYTKIDSWPYELNDVTVFRVSIGYNDTDETSIVSYINKLLEMATNN